ncbi:MAG: hypothetical protein WCO67_26765, partial [Betaproteobacteria bacterium]
GPTVKAAVDTDVVTIDRTAAPDLFARYGVADTATYVLRPDGHVLARCMGVDPAFAETAIAAALAGGDPARARIALPPSPQLEMDRRYDAYAAEVDATPEPGRPAMLGALVGKLAQQVGVPTHPRES